jgi:hypothetical protein
LPGVVCTEINRPLLSNANPFEPLVFSRKVEVWLLASMRVIRFACVSVKMRLPSGMPIGPSVPLKPLLMTSTLVPAAITPGIAVAVVSAATGGVCPP